VKTNDKPSFCPEYHKWAIRIYPGGRNKWEIVPEKWELHTIQNGGLALANGECAHVADRVSAEIVWLDYQQRMRWRDGR